MSLTQRGFDVIPVPLPSRDDLSLLVQRTMEVDASLVLVDLDLGEAGDGGRLIAPLTRSGRRVVVLTASRDISRHGACIARGAWTTLTKSTHLDVMVPALSMTAMGVPLVSPAQRRELMRRSPVNSHLDETRARLERLSPREAHVLGALANGQRVREIATQSFVSEGTVRTQVKSILNKLGVTSQLAAVAMAHEVGWKPRS